MGKLLQEKGTRIDYVEIDSDKQWGAISRGKIHFQLEVWGPSMAGVFKQHPKVVDAGTHSAIVREEWWYPAWVENYCPGLPHWSALKKCAHLFSTNNSAKGTYYTGPWDYDDPEMIRALKLNFEIKRVSTDEALWALLAQSQIDEKPIIMLNWTPNWTDNRVAGKFIEFPPYSTQCEQDAAHGINKEMTHDCGNPKKGWLKKAKWFGLGDAYPCIDQFIENINFSNNMISEASALARAYDRSEDEAANLWLEKFSKQAQKWFPQSCQMSSKIKLVTDF